MTTKAEMRQRVAEDLTLTVVGGAVQSQDQIRIDDTYDEVYALLKNRGLATWASTADVPADVTPYYALMMEEKLLISYSVSPARYERIVLGAGPGGEAALKMISSLVMPDYESTDCEQDF